MHNKTILITGVAGLLGSRLAEYIIEKKPGNTVIGIDDLSGGYESNIPQEVKFYKANTFDDTIKDIFELEQPDIVYHFAAYAAEGLSPFVRTFNYDNNLKSTAAIVNECIKHNVERLVFTSTMAVYGHGWEGKRPFEEVDPPQPIDPYGIAKYACEMDIQCAGVQHGLDWCILRPHNVYGRNQNIWDKYRNVLGIWMYQYMNDMPLTIFGDGYQRRAWSSIDDCLEPMWKAAFIPKASKEIINLGGTEFTTINEACRIVREVMAAPENSIKPKDLAGVGADIQRIKEIPVAYQEARHEVKNAYPTWRKSELILGFEHTTSLKDGLTDMWKWAQTQPNRERFIWENYELEKGIYSFWKNDKSNNTNLPKSEVSGYLS